MTVRLILSFVVLMCVPQFAVAQQNVFLDFDSGNDGNINYTASMRNDVQSLMETIYQDFGVSFFQFNPGGPFTRLTFNEGGTGGLAEGIDFRNLNKNDNAVINVDGLGFNSTSDIVGLTANIGAHEFGHLMGLRHRDSFGPIGSGVIPGVVGSFLPSYPGLTNAVEFGDHVMSTPALGADVNRFTQPVWMSERSAIKLASIDQLALDFETAGDNNSIAAAQALNLGKMAVPNTILSGQNADLGPLFDVDAISVAGSITAGDQDFYRFDGAAGDLFNFEVMSRGNDNIVNSFDTQLMILDINGNALDYYGSDAFNDDEIETSDSTIIDLVLQDSGSFFVRVDGFSSTSSGDYELFFHRFNGAFAVPEPSAWLVLAGFAFTGLLTRRRTA